MADGFTLNERPRAGRINLIAGWRQWADAGSVSSGLPEYLISHTGAQLIGELSSGPYYLFQIPGTHDLVRPVVHFEEGFPISLEERRNQFFYKGDSNEGLAIFLGDEPHLNVEGYVAAVLDAAREIGARRIIGLGGVYGELPYDRERLISCNYSQPTLKAELQRLAVNLSDYQGGASIGSIMCRRAADRSQEYAGFYAFVPALSFPESSEEGPTGLRIEADYTAWLGIMRRVKYFLRLDLDLSDLEQKSQALQTAVDERVAEIARTSPDIAVQAYLQNLAENFEEQVFEPSDEFWENELNRLFGDIGESGEDARGGEEAGDGDVADEDVADGDVADDQGQGASTGSV